MKLSSIRLLLRIIQRKIETYGNDSQTLADHCRHSLPNEYDMATRGLCPTFDQDSICTGYIYDAQGIAVWSISVLGAVLLKHLGVEMAEKFVLEKEILNFY